TMPSKTQPTLGHIRGTAPANAAVSLTTSTGQSSRTQIADGRGWFAFVDVPPGSYTVAASGALLGYALVSAGQIASVTTTPPAATPTPSPTPSPTPTPPPGACANSVGPGIPPPAAVPAGIPGFHAAWWGQSGYMTLCPGGQLPATVAYKNSGARGWVSGRMGEVAYLGTWSPEPGQDRASPLGGDGTLGSPNTGWPRYNRIAIQPAAYVGPDQVSWFQFTVQAPMTPGTYRLYLRPLVEGAQWMEDYGVYWLVTVRS
ncbi:MAG TPA: carboxypeptidase-like regulatory domain-containing protein, partial [Candidatus Limnocylindria bacterium]|nr:carboxypeptidase-like regulatory domain-containing protein [Candidatus Limnocylindria bacterium]